MGANQSPALPVCLFLRSSPLPAPRSRRSPLLTLLTLLPAPRWYILCSERWRMQNTTQMRKTTRLGVAASVLLLLAAGVQAGTVSYTYTATQPDTLTDWSHAFSLAQFNPSLGTLDSVQISVSYDLHTEAAIQNTSSKYSQVGIQIGSLFSLTLPNQSTTLSLALTADSGQYLLAPGGAATYGAYDLSQTTSLTLTGAQLNEFIGDGSISITGHTDSWEAISMKGGDTKVVPTTLAGATVTITYNDMPAPVPEPSVAALLLLGVGGLAGRFYRGRRTA